MAKIGGVILRTDMPLVMKNGEEVFITPLALKKSADRNGWEVQSVPGKPGHLQAIAEMECHKLIFESDEVSMGIESDG